jgi:hypothetical protein
MTMTDPAAKTEAIEQQPARRAAMRRIRTRAVEREAGRFDWSEWKAWRPRKGGAMSRAVIVTSSSALLPARLFAPMPKAAKRAREFFTAHLNNDHAREG